MGVGPEPGHIGPSLGEGPQGLVFPQNVMLRVGPKLGACTRKEGQEREGAQGRCVAHRKVTASLSGAVESAGGPGEATAL
jgi:hypothetical protein